MHKKPKNNNSLKK